MRSCVAAPIQSTPYHSSPSSPSTLETTRTGALWPRVRSRVSELTDGQRRRLPPPATRPGRPMEATFGGPSGSARSAASSSVDGVPTGPTAAAATRPTRSSRGTQTSSCPRAIVRRRRMRVRRAVRRGRCRAGAVRFPAGRPLQAAIAASMSPAARIPLPTARRCPPQTSRVGTQLLVPAGANSYSAARRRGLSVRSLTDRLSGLTSSVRAVDGEHSGAVLSVGRNVHGVADADWAEEDRAAEAELELHCTSIRLQDVHVAGKRPHMQATRA